MRNNILTMCLASVVLVVALGCSTQSPTGPSGVALPTAGLGSPVAANFSGAAPTVGVLKGPRPRPEAWVDGERFAGVVTPAIQRMGEAVEIELLENHALAIESISGLPILT